ncbi:MAG: phosphatidate cytidylyltransferase [Spirochaetaceae bacterium]|nr:phosphatidate cytidylyltransferase [Spirochaetaceae bacterium]MBO4704377.1 phosphatidate cytidylyltransferase [Spirochaetaceae bacterium]
MAGCNLYESGAAGIEQRKRFYTIAKELFRKTIHMGTALVPLVLYYSKTLIVSLLITAIVLYSITEILRLSGKSVPIVSKITEAASRKRDDNRFVLGPITLCVGVLLTVLLFDFKTATAGIFALAFGDGLASLGGKLIGQCVIPFTQGKTAAGSLTCFIAIFLSSFAVFGSVTLSLSVAALGMFIELLPLRDFDNLIIPVAVSSLIYFCF